MKRGIRNILLALSLMALALSLSACIRVKRPRTEQTPTVQVTQATQPTMATAAATLPTIAPTEPTEMPETQPTLPPETEPAEQTFTLTFLGDCTFGCMPSVASAETGFFRTVGQDYSYPFRNVSDLISQDALTILTLEGPLTDSIYPLEGTKGFHGPSDYMNFLTQNSIDFVSIANDHMEDYGKTGLDDTISLLEGARIPYVQRDCSVLVPVDRGFTVGFYASTFHLLDQKAIASGISSLKNQGADLVIFAPHWGAEMSYVPTWEQVKIAHAAIEAGADIVWGTHTHCLQPVEFYQGGTILYSMGSFIYGGNTNPTDYDTAIVQIDVTLDSNGAISIAKPIATPMRMSSSQWNNDYQPVPYAEGTAEYLRVMSKLGLN